MRNAQDVKGICKAGLPLPESWQKELTSENLVTALSQFFRQNS